jgi:hypothetical protein
MVGHRTEAIYRRYAIVSEGDIQRAGQQLAQLHSQEAPTSTGVTTGVAAIRGGHRTLT